MPKLVHPSNYEWFKQKCNPPVAYTIPQPDANRALQFSMRIQTAYEKESPLLIISTTSFGLTQFCGYVERIDPQERWIQLSNGCIRKKIRFDQIVELEVV